MQPSVLPEPFSFWRKVVPGPDCWKWKGMRQVSGYGAFMVRHGDKFLRRRAHRVAWEFVNGPIPEGLCVLHRCDVPDCCNPDHLFLGTFADNNADKAIKGRAPHGETHSKAKLSNQQVRDIKTLAWTESCYDVAERYAVSGTVVLSIWHGRHRKRC